MPLRSGMAPLQCHAQMVDGGEGHMIKRRLWGSVQLALNGRHWVELANSRLSNRFAFREQRRPHRHRSVTQSVLHVYRRLH